MFSGSEAGHIDHIWPEELQLTYIV